MGDSSALVDHLFRREAGQMVATLTRHLGARHLALAEEAVQDALLTALQQWPFAGVPDNPAAWLYRTARNKALDRLRHERIVVEKQPAVSYEHTPRGVAPTPDTRLSGEMPPVDDDQLGLMFLTCHPTLPRESRVALTLKIVGGFSVGEIARAFIAQESAIAQRLVRAKRQLRDEDVAFGTPEGAVLGERVDSVLEAIYLMFNEGNAATDGDALVRGDIAHESIRLARLLAAHPVTATPRAWALLALLLLHAARFPSRVSEDGTLFTLRDQDRARWDRRLIAEGFRALDSAAAGDEVSAYHLEAGIAACHAAAGSWDATDWRAITELYDELMVLTRSPVVALNRAVAIAQIDGPRAGIDAIEAMGAHHALARYHLLHATLAELWRQAGDAGRAAEAYRDALRCAQSAPERRFLATRLEQL